jgi:SAM-dependent methyltransferase
MPPGESRFGEVSTEYEAFRVGFTSAIWDHLARTCGLAPGIRALDLGCGTGISTLPLIEYGTTVVGVDPDPAMLRIAERKLGGKAALIEAHAEALPFEDESFDLVLAAQSAHFFTEPDATREVRRILRIGGSVAYLWKYPAPHEPYVYLVDELMAQLTGEQVRTVYGVGTVPDLLGPGFSEYRRDVFEQPVPYTNDRYVGYVSSRDRVLKLAGAKRDTLLELIAERLARLQPGGAFVEYNLVYVVSARRIA